MFLTSNIKHKFCFSHHMQNKGFDDTQRTRLSLLSLWKFCIMMMSRVAEVNKFYWDSIDI